MDTFPYYEATVGFIVVAFVGELYLDWRQYKVYRDVRTVPPYLKDSIDLPKFVKAQEYGLRQGQLSFVQSGWNLMETAVLLTGGRLAAVWAFCQSILARWGYGAEYQISAAVVFVAVYIIYSSITSLPFALYKTFVIEEEFGFNKQTYGLFFKDKAKGLAIGFALQLPITAGVVYIISHLGEYFFLYLWGFIVVITIVLIYLYPILIAPLFNTYTDLPAGGLKDRIESLASVVGFPLNKIYVVDGSKRSSHSNAYCYGFWKTWYIVIYDTLMDQCDCDGVEAIVGHELGHYHESHVLKMLAVQEANLLFIFWLFSRMVYDPALYDAFGFDGSARPAFIGLLLFSVVISPISHVTSFLSNKISRRFEYAADAFAHGMGYELEEPLVALMVENLSGLAVDPWYSAYYHTHPTLLERIDALAVLNAKAGRSPAKRKMGTAEWVTASAAAAAEAAVAAARDGAKGGDGDGDGDDDAANGESGESNAVADQAGSGPTKRKGILKH